MQRVGGRHSTGLTLPAPVHPAPAEDSVQGAMAARQLRKQYGRPVVLSSTKGSVPANSAPLAKMPERAF